MATAAASSGQDQFDLLPYVSILMCVLGTLLLVTLGFAALSLGPGAGEGWIVSPAEGVRAKTPLLVEWDGQFATFHGQGGPTRVAWLEETAAGVSREVPLSKRTRTTDFSRLIAELEGRRSTDYALFAVRPSGFQSFDRFADDFRGKGINVGYEPIAQTRPVKLIMKGETR
ncbi:hypothetical protein [Accumulibacter sp.]|uniref:hypothetical protein n=1 Tax=Accumulibacter sp. TaxID=2053492 RepID=UPI0025D6F8DC|nr:hypothetical protein [Accumulibacter sp.]MCM8595569.1 hypothetical protein [Accumulibacter sp.]MCM8625060.1 hypothetical protein [Accumulibacter sp.]MDS4049717.1 hypothetical protein [Accumulibacter sp.]